MDIPTALYQVFNGGSPRVATEYPDGVGWLWISQYCHSMIHNEHNNRRDLLRMLRGSHKIRAFGEDLGDPAEVVTTVRVTVRQVARATAAKLAQLARQGVTRLAFIRE